MAGRRSAAEDSHLTQVEFLCNDDAEWALFWVVRPEYGSRYREQLYARKVSRNRITFGRSSRSIAEGGAGTPSDDGERTFPIATLRRVIDNGLPGTRGGRFLDKTADSVTYRTTCGERRVVRLSVLRALVEDAEALP